MIAAITRSFHCSTGEARVAGIAERARHHPRSAVCISLQLRLHQYLQRMVSVKFLRV